MKKWSSVVLALVLSAFVQFWTGGVAVAADKLAWQLQSLGGDDEARVIVKMADQLDPQSVTAGVKGRNKGMRTRLLVQALKDRKDGSQKNVIKLLDAMASQGRAKKIKQLWIVNAVVLSATRDVLDELAAMPEVMEIYPEGMVYLEEPVTAAVTTEDNIALVGAPAMWDMGFTGQGVVVAGVDSGVDFQHPDLASSYRGGSNSWYDPNGQHSAPYDADGHGTQTMGVMVGGSAGGTAIGVAPGAQWIAAKIFNDSGVAYVSGVHEAYEWVLDPDGDSGTDDAPDIVNNSWGEDAPGFCDDEFAPDIAALRAAGILPVFSAGNSGPSGSTDLSPANNDGAFSVGATDNFDNPQIYSSRGPGSCDGSLFPILAAPGTGIRTTGLSYGGYPLYNYVDGTSFSAPHVSGAAALLLSATPGMTLEELEETLIGGAQDILPAGPDYSTGYGRVDALASYGFAVPEVLAAPELLAPADGDSFWKKGDPPTFSWQANSAVAFELQVSKFSDFHKMKVFPCESAGPTVVFVPDYKMWKKIRNKSKKGLPAYWRVKGVAPDGRELMSPTRTFTVYRNLPVL